VDISQEDLRACAKLIGRKAIAKECEVSKSTVTNWHNGNVNVPPRPWAFAANTLELKKNKNGRGITVAKLEQILGIPLPHLQERDCLVELPVESVPVISALLYFERFEAAQLDAAWTAKRRGRPSKKTKNKSEKCADSHTFTGRIEDFIRKKYALGGKDKYREAHAIWTSKRHELMEAVHEELLTIHGAWKLLKVSPAETKALLSRKNRSEIRAFIARLPK